MTKTRIVFAVLVWGLLAGSVFAQTTTNAMTPTSRFEFDQEAPDLTTAQVGYVYRLYADASPSRIVPVTCAGTASPFRCSTPVGAFTPGPHTVWMTASNAAGESDKSNALTFTMVVVPSAPRMLPIPAVKPPIGLISGVGSNEQEVR